MRPIIMGESAIKRALSETIYEFSLPGKTINKSEIVAALNERFILLPKPEKITDIEIIDTINEMRSSTFCELYDFKAQNVSQWVQRGLPKDYAGIFSVRRIESLDLNLVDVVDPVKAKQFERVRKRKVVRKKI